MATHSCILAWEIPQTEKPGRLQPMEVTKEWDMTQQLNNNNNNKHIIISKIQLGRADFMLAVIKVNFVKTFKK